MLKQVCFVIYDKSTLKRKKGRDVLKMGITSLYGCISHGWSWKIYELIHKSPIHIHKMQFFVNVNEVTP